MSTNPIFPSLGVNTVSLDVLLGRLRRLKDHSGRMKADGLWMDDDEPRSLTIEEITDDAQSATNANFKSLRRMKKTLLAMEALTSSLRDVISIVQKNTRPAVFQHGTNSLPTEILTDIFKLACDPKTLVHLNLSQVCRRFRGIAVGIPELWTYISPQQSPEWRKFQVSRSGDSGLIVDFSTHGRRVQIDRCPSQRDPCMCMGYLAFVMKHADRWLEFNFTVHHDLLYDRPTKQQISVLLDGLCLPRLERLSISDECTTSGESRVIDSWRTPRLRSLSCSQDMIPLIVTVESEHSITSLHLDINDVRPAARNVDPLRFLVHPNLAAIEDLSVTIRSYERIGPTIADSTLKTCFHSLRTLRIDFNAFLSNEHTIINDIFANIDTPKLETLSVRFELYSGDVRRSHFYVKSNAGALMQKFGRFLQWMAQPLPTFRKRFPLLKLIKIHVEGHREVDEKTLDEQFRKRLRQGWQPGGNVRRRDRDFLEKIPRVELTFDAWQWCPEDDGYHSQESQEV